MRNITIALVLSLLTVACGVEGPVDAPPVPGDGAQGGPSRSAADAAVAIEHIEVAVEPCLCRCVTDTNTTLTVSGRGFAAGMTADIDGAAVAPFVIDEGTLSIALWESPAAGAHTLSIRAPGTDGAAHVAPAAVFFMP